MAHNAIYQHLHETSYGAVGVALLDAELHPAICICRVYEPSIVTEIGRVHRGCFVDAPIVLRAEMCELTNRGLRRMLAVWVGDGRKAHDQKQSDEKVGQTVTFHEWPLTLELSGGEAVRLERVVRYPRGWPDMRNERHEVLHEVDINQTRG